MSDTGLEFNEEWGVFLNPMVDIENGAKMSVHEAYVDVYSGDRKIAQIRENGDVTYGERKPGSTIYYVTLTSAQRKEVDQKADIFQRKCDVEALVAACEEIMTLKQFPMVQDPPSESPLIFNEGNNGDANILKEGYLIGTMRTRGPEFGRLILLYPLIHTGLTETDKAAIIAKCREIVAAIIL